ncbi:MAG: hypothetical protein AAGF53_19295 [Pseudomonadota bacterium]
MQHKILLLLPLFLLGCSENTGSIDNYLVSRNLTDASRTDMIVHCHGYGCKLKSEVSLSNADWNQIARNFNKKPSTPKAERAAIKNALGTFEQIVGAKTGTDQDRKGTFKRLGHDQHDCVDESINASVYMRAMIEKGLIKFHFVGTPETRLPLFHTGTWPHQAATIYEIDSKKKYVVDTWWEDNGRPAHIVPFDDWKTGWRADEV